MPADKCTRTSLTKFEDETAAKMSALGSSDEVWLCSDCRKWHRTDRNSPKWKKEQYAIEPGSKRTIKRRAARHRARDRHGRADV